MHGFQNTNIHIYIIHVSIQNVLRLMMFDVIKAFQHRGLFCEVCLIRTSLRPRQTDADSSMPALISHMTLIMQRERETQRERDGERERHIEKERDRETHTHRERERESETHRERDRETHI